MGSSCPFLERSAPLGPFLPAISAGTGRPLRRRHALDRRCRLGMFSSPSRSTELGGHQCDRGSARTGSTAPSGCRPLAPATRCPCFAIGLGSEMGAGGTLSRSRLPNGTSMAESRSASGTYWLQPANEPCLRLKAAHPKKPRLAAEDVGDFTSPRPHRPTPRHDRFRRCCRKRRWPRSLRRRR